MPSPDIEVRELSCTLTESELLARGEAMADAELQEEQLKAERAGVTEQIKGRQVLRRKLAGVIDSGTEKRDVRCAWIEDFAQNCFHLVRQDTGEVIDTRAMTADDRQEALFDGEPKQPAGEATIDLDDVPDDDADPDDDSDDEDDERELDDEPAEPEDEPAAPPLKTKGKGRARTRQSQPNV
jgi:hypothetical protein